MVSCHIECFKDEKEVSKYVQSLWFEYPEAMLGIAINPSTSMDLLEDCLHLFDYVLVMSVEPGYGGQSFIMDTVDKIKKLKELKGNYLIEVDGGINDNTINLVSDADIVVVGSYITSGDYSERIKKLKEKIYG